MDVMEAIRQRRSIRHFTADDIPDAVLDRLLAAMRLAPSGSNTQPWKFVVVRDKKVKSQVAAACSFRRPDGNVIRQDWIDEAPIVIVACGSERDAAVRYYRGGEIIVTKWPAWEAEMADVPTLDFNCLLTDLSIALDHLTLAAMAEGLGTCWIGGLDERQMRKALSIPEGVRAPLAVVLGYPVSWPEPRPRKPLSEIVCYDRYS